MKKLNEKTYKEKVLGCWLGKAAGGTLGGPYEGICRQLNLKYYDPVPTKMLPNDDLDLQIVWAVKLAQMKQPVISRYNFISAWQENIGYSWDEYGVAKRNIALGLKPPLTGSYDNWFVNGMGAAIRSEIWACLAPGNPELAASYAFEDACVDHADNGIYAEMLLAAMESVAFIESNMDRIIDYGLSAIPHCSIKQAIIDTCNWWYKLRDWKEVRFYILNNYRDDNWTDVHINIPFIILGLLAGGGDFGQSIRIAANCGYDTDCTAATVGSILGIINPNSIGSEWLKPLGRNIVLSPEIIGIKSPANLNMFTEMIVDLRNKLAERPPIVQEVSQSTNHLKIHARMALLDFYLDKNMPKIGFACWQMPESAVDIYLNGTIGRLEGESISSPTVIIQYEINIKNECDAIIMFNTRNTYAVWVDNECVLSFRYESPQPMVPALHRGNSKKSHHFTPGKHTITAVTNKPEYDEDLEWVIGLSDTKKFEWLVDVFERGLLST